MSDNKWITVKIPREQYNQLKDLAETRAASMEGIVDVHSAIRIALSDKITKLRQKNKYIDDGAFEHVH